MARPKSGQPTKQKLSLCISPQGRANLEFISKCRNESISAMLERWAEKEAKKVAKEMNREIPDVNQITIDEVLCDKEKQEH